MQDAVKGLLPEGVWKYFSEISEIPRESGNEEGIRQYLLAFAKAHKLESTADAVGNVIIRKNASPGAENRGWTALQGHMDMVCVKKAGSTHDFARDPIELVREGDILRAKDTTLGGDNGIALAMILDILADESCVHGPLEAIFTVSEETGLTGAFGLEKKDVRSRRLLNLDSEEEDIIYIGCAGGADVEATLDADQHTVPEGWTASRLTVSGLLGGHSGGEIDKQRANAIKVAVRILSSVDTVMLFGAEGGTKRNVIPSHCTFDFAYPESEREAVERTVETQSAALRSEFAQSDPGLSVSCVRETVPEKAASAAQSRALIRSLYLAPHGVQAMSMTLPGIVETSANLALIRFENGRFFAASSHRSSIMSARDDIARHTQEAMRTCGAKAAVTGSYPSWQPNAKSPLAALCAKAYEDYTGKKPLVTAIHAGLECGIINSRIPGMDSVSFGPAMSGVHSVDERLSVSSVARISAFTKHLLSILP